MLANEAFAEEVSLDLLIPADEIEDARRLVADRTRGSGVVDVGEESD